MKFELPKLPYRYNALEPYIDEQTMVIHHTKHHQTYLDNLNKLIENIPDDKYKSAEDILTNINDFDEKVRQAVINNCGGYVNHNFFWFAMSPKKTKPEGKFSENLEKTFGTLESFKQKFIEKSLSLFGSGWVFLISDKNGKLSLKRHSFQNSPLFFGNTPILAVDLWEHAYYLKYQNRKAEYLDAFWNVIDWQKVSDIYNDLPNKIIELSLKVSAI